MQLKERDLKTLAEIATQAAREAGALIARYRERELVVLHKAGGDSLASQVVTEVDELSQDIVLKHLVPTLEAFDLALLTEESPDDGSRHAKDYFWCIDPLDGTLPFTQGIAGYSVSIALVRRDGTPVIGVVFDPMESKLYRAVEGVGIEINGAKWTAPIVRDPATESLRFYCDCTFSMHPERASTLSEMEAFALRLGYAGLTVETGGGAVLNACWTLENPPACYFKKPKITAGGGSLWDFAATACLFNTAGKYARDFHGAVLDLNRLDSTFMNHRGVCYTSCASIAHALREGL